MDSRISKTAVDYDGLLTVLGENLYSSPSVVLRELIQNAHDACSRRRFEAEVFEAPEIRLFCDPQERSLTIRDNGSGLTYDEVHQYLATIGAGYTRLLRDELGHDKLIGYFGLGFLSAYVVSDKVEVTTRSYQSPENTWLFSSKTGKNFSITEQTHSTHPVGTSVKLYLKESYLALSQQATLVRLVEKHCCMLPLPIYLSESSQALNTLTAPWLDRHNMSAQKIEHATHVFAEKFEKSFEPVFSFLLPENDLELEGVVWIQSGATYDTSDNRSVSTFVRGMFITDEMKEMLPSWAGFMGAVLESTHFKPTASRESLQKDEYYRKVLAFVKEQVIVNLRYLVLRHSVAWRKTLDLHREALLGAAICDDRLFDVMKRSLKVTTSQGDLTLFQIMRASQGSIYVKLNDNKSYEETLFRAKRIPLVFGHLYAALSICRKFSEIEGRTLNLLDGSRGNEKLFEPCAVGTQQSKQLTELFANDREQVIFCQYSPEFLPLVVIYDEEVLLKQRIEDKESDKRMGSAILNLARLHTKQINNSVVCKVYLNLNNPVVKKLCDMPATKRPMVAKVLRSYMDGLNHNYDTDESEFDDILVNFNHNLNALVSEG